MSEIDIVVRTVEGWERDGLSSDEIADVLCRLDGIYPSGPRARALLNLLVAMLTAQAWDGMTCSEVARVARSLRDAMARHGDC